MIKVKVKSHFEMKQALDGDVGFDVRATEDIYIPNLATVTIPTGVYVELPEGVECQVRPKSGLSSEGILVHFGTVDNGYRGEIGVNVTNINNKTHTIPVDSKGEVVRLEKGKPLYIEKGQKIAQLVFKRYENVDLTFIKSISTDTDRGSNGFGSTGTH